MRVALSVVTSRIPLFVICAQNALNKFVGILMVTFDPYLTLSRLLCGIVTAYETAAVLTVSFVSCIDFGV